MKYLWHWNYLYLKSYFSNKNKIKSSTPLKISRPRNSTKYLYWISIFKWLHWSSAALPNSEILFSIRQCRGQQQFHTLLFKRLTPILYSTGKTTGVHFLLTDTTSEKHPFIIAYSSITIDAFFFFHVTSITVNTFFFLHLTGTATNALL